MNRHLRTLQIKLIVMSHSTRLRRLALAVSKGIWIFGLLGWLYGVSNVYLFPQFQLINLSYYVPIPTNLFTDGCFVIALFAFIIWEYLK
jgi:hypothetical protein